MSATGIAAERLYIDASGIAVGAGPTTPLVVDGPTDSSTGGSDSSTGGSGSSTGGSGNLVDGSGNLVDGSGNLVDGSGSDRSAKISGEITASKDEAMNYDSKDEASPTDDSVGGYIISVSDSSGFVGAFLSIAEASERVLTKYSLVPFLVQRYKLYPCSLQTVWAVPIRDSLALAIVTNSRDEAERVRRAYALVGLAHDDSVDYWVLGMGQLVPGAAERLESIRRAHEMYASEAIETELKKQQSVEDAIQAAMAKGSEGVAKDGPFAQVLRENARIGFVDCIIDVGYEDEYEDDTVDGTTGTPDIPDETGTPVSPDETDEKGTPDMAASQIAVVHDGSALAAAAETP